ncbi:hypothetical protein IAQ61_005766 [Plenodomus lingam]|uniref:uncharacterized protein n=1 Tax=Leptosphaeria maculans TaxID=5022 RepID=UPI0033225769|nr:hypothetical protein IAQ61_005766 [Plenodomus lingam]
MAPSGEHAVPVLFPAGAGTLGVGGVGLGAGAGVADGVGALPPWVVGGEATGAVTMTMVRKVEVWAMEEGADGAWETGGAAEGAVGGATGDAAGGAGAPLLPSPPEAWFAQRGLKAELPPLVT